MPIAQPIIGGFCLKIDMFVYDISIFKTHVHEADNTLNTDTFINEFKYGN